MPLLSEVSFPKRLRANMAHDSEIGRGIVLAYP